MREINSNEQIKVICNAAVKKICLFFIYTRTASPCLGSGLLSVFALPIYSPTPADEHMKESEAARAAGEGPSAPAAPGNPQPMACWGNQPENTVQEGQPQEGGDAVPAPGASETWCQPMPKPAAQPAPTNIAPTDITPTDMSLDP